MGKEYYLGFDIGSSSCKTIIINKKGKIIGSASKELWADSPKPGFGEIDPNEWYKGFLETLKDVCGYSNINPQDIHAIGITGQLVSFTCIDKEYNPLRPAILWYDKRGSEELQLIKSKIGNKISEISSNPLNNTFTLPKLLWIKKKEPEIFKNIFKILWASDYVRMRLTKTINTDPTDASSSMMYDLKKGIWSKEITAEMEIPNRILPPIKEAVDIAGSVISEVSSITGLKTGTPVIIGAGDIAMDNVAAGIISPGQGMLRLGTCGVISIVSEKPLLDMNNKCPCSASIVPGLSILQGTSAAFGSSLRWFRDTFYKTNTGSREGKGGDAFSEIDKEASLVSPGADGLFFHTFTNAAPYWETNIRGQFTGIRYSQRREHFARAIFEGTAYDLKKALINMSNIKGAKIPIEFICVGRGILNKTWCQTISNVLGYNLVLAKEADAALGAAMVAGVSVGGFKDLKDSVSKTVHYLGEVKFKTDINKYYNERFKDFSIIHENLVKVCNSIY